MRNSAITIVCHLTDYFKPTVTSWYPRTIRYVDRGTITYASETAVNEYVKSYESVGIQPDGLSLFLYVKTSGIRRFILTIPEAHPLFNLYCIFFLEHSTTLNAWLDKAVKSFLQKIIKNSYQPDTV